MSSQRADGHPLRRHVPEPGRHLHVEAAVQQAAEELVGHGAGLEPRGGDDHALRPERVGDLHRVGRAHPDGTAVDLGRPTGLRGDEPHHPVPQGGVPQGPVQVQGLVAGADDHDVPQGMAGPAAADEPPAHQEPLGGDAGQGDRQEDGDPGPGHGGVEQPPDHDQRDRPDGHHVHGPTELVDEAGEEPRCVHLLAGEQERPDGKGQGRGPQAVPGGPGVPAEQTGGDEGGDHVGQCHGQHVRQHDARSSAGPSGPNGGRCPAPRPAS